MSDPGRKRDFDTSAPDRKGRKEDLMRELEKLRNTRGSSRQFIQELYKKYPEEFVDEFNRMNAKRLEGIRRKAESVARKVITKYHNSNRPLHEIMAKMVKYKNQNDWTDVEYEVFRSELEKKFQGKRAYEIDYNQGNEEFRSRINRTLGYRPQQAYEDGLKIKETEHGTLSEILSMYERSLPLYRANFVDSLTYDDSGLQAISGEFNSGKHVASNHIHPLIACMFVPKIGYFENQVVYSNIGGIIKARYEGKPIMTEADAMLFNDMVTDPNDVVCDESSPIVDLKKRYQVQIDLWEIIQNLRYGKYYDGNANQRLLTNLNMCRNNLYDYADLTYNQDEGAMLRRIMNVFSMRPTLISTRPISAIESFVQNPWAMSMTGLGLNQMQQTGVPYVNKPVITITKIPMMVFQLPVKGILGGNGGNEAINIQQAASAQLIWINEKGALTPREQSVIHSREVMIFYANRRISRVNVRTLINPLIFSPTSPVSFSNFERINDHPVEIPDQIVLTNGGDPYDLRSVVAVTETNVKPCSAATGIGNSLITGCIGLIKTLPSHPISTTGALAYDPFGASIPIPAGGGFTLDKPFTSIHMYIPPHAPGSSQTFTEIASKRGTIFIYARPCGAGGAFRCEDFISF